MKTLSTEFAELRNRRGLTLLEVGNRCKIAESTVWKIEHGKSVRWETVHLCLTLALNVQLDMDEYTEFQALWLEDRNSMAESHPADFNSPKIAAHTSAAIKQFRKIIADLDPIETNVVIASAERAAQWLEQAQ